MDSRRCRKTWEPEWWCWKASLVRIPDQEETTMILTVFVTTILVLCASLFALIAVVPLMIENRTTRKLPDNIVPFPKTQQPSGRTGSPAA